MIDKVKAIIRQFRPWIMAIISQKSPLKSYRSASISFSTPLVALGDKVMQPNHLPAIAIRLLQSHGVPDRRQTGLDPSAIQPNDDGHDLLMFPRTPSWQVLKRPWRDWRATVGRPRPYIDHLGKRRETLAETMSNAEKGPSSRALLRTSCRWHQTISERAGLGLCHR